MNHIQIQKTPGVGDEKVSVCPIMWHELPIAQLLAGQGI